MEKKSVSIFLIGYIIHTDVEGSGWWQSLIDSKPGLERSFQWMKGSKKKSESTLWMWGLWLCITLKLSLFFCPHTISSIHNILSIIPSTGSLSSETHDNLGSLPFCVSKIPCSSLSYSLCQQVSCSFKLY